LNLNADYAYIHLAELELAISQMQNESIDEAPLVDPERVLEVGASSPLSFIKMFAKIG
jgi:hypothetical protein